MLNADNTAKVLALCGEGLVLDIGGWADPFPRADYVLDYFTYETRRLAYHGINRLPVTCRYPDPLPGERFTRATWRVHDICGPDPFPFPDKMFDFVICSHTLEDVRDPLRVCAEMIRVGKAGYIETPSRLSEQTMAYEGTPGIVGCAHHRWLVEADGNRLLFRPKQHFLHTDRAVYVPRRYLRRCGDAARTCAFFWRDQFDYGEIWACDLCADAARYVASLGIPGRDYLMDRWDERLRRLAGVLEKPVRRYHQFRRWFGRIRRGQFRPAPNTTRSEALWTWDALFEAAMPRPPHGPEPSANGREGGDGR